MKNICIGLFEGETLPESLAAFKDVKLDLEFGKITTIHTLNQLDCEKIVVVGLGDGKKNIKEAFSKVEADDYFVYVNENTAYAAGFGLVYGAYSYKETKVYDFESDGFTAEFEKGKTVASIVNHAREMSDMPANFLTPDHLVDEAKMVSEKYGMEMEVLDHDDLDQLGAGALLAVNQGSDRPCYMVVIRYDGGKEDEEYTALVGKGYRSYSTAGRRELYRLQTQQNQAPKERNCHPHPHYAGDSGIDRTAAICLSYCRKLFVTDHHLFRLYGREAIQPHPKPLHQISEIFEIVGRRTRYRLSFNQLCKPSYNGNDLAIQ